MSDLISRQVAIDYVDDVPYIKDHPNIGLLWKAWVERLPSAQPEIAKRIVGKSRDGMTLWYQCDMCNEPVDAQDNFCSGCGRRLVNG